MHPLDPLLEKNRAWSEKIRKSDPDFFPTLSRQQAPTYLWIGCSDSRVPANEICGLLPGEIFVHRNVANIVVHSDLNCLSVMQYAVDVLLVKHIIVVGHYGCGGVRAALEKKPFGLIDNWLRHVQDVTAKYTDHLSCIKDESMKVDRLCELNVIAQTINAAQTTIVQNAWERGLWLKGRSGTTTRNQSFQLGRPCRRLEDAVGEKYGLAGKPLGVRSGRGRFVPPRALLGIEAAVLDGLQADNGRYTHDFMDAGTAR